MWVSTRTPKPPGRLSAVIRPGEGAKLIGSSALTRHSIAWPRGLKSPGEARQRLAGRQADLLAHQIETVTISVTGCSTWMRVFISMK